MRDQEQDDDEKSEMDFAYGVCCLSFHSLLRLEMEGERERERSEANPRRRIQQQ